MSIELAPKKAQKPNDIVHNSSNTSASETKRILNTTSEQAHIDYYFEQLIENFSNIRAAWEQKMDEVHRGKILLPIQSNVDELKNIIKFLRAKGGNTQVKPDISFLTLNVSVEAIFKDDCVFTHSDISELIGIMNLTMNFTIESLPRDVGMRIYFVYEDVGEYVDASEVNKS